MGTTSFWTLPPPLDWKWNRRQISDGITFSSMLYYNKESDTGL